MITPDESGHIGDETVEEYRRIERDMLIVLGGVILSRKILDTSSARIDAAACTTALLTIIARSNAEKVTRESTESLLTMSARADARRCGAGMKTMEELLSSAKFESAVTSDRVMKSLRNTNVGIVEGAKRLYVSEASKASIAVNTGRKTLEEAQRDAVVNMASRGITATTEIRANGTFSVPTDVSVRRTMRTEITQANNRQTISNAEKLGHDLIEVSSCYCARPSHAVWQGKVYCLKGTRGNYRNYYKSCNVGDMVDGIGGYNCDHTTGIYIEGTRKHYQSNPLKGTGYTQDDARALLARQRVLENDIRKLKRENGVLDGLDMQTGEISTSLAAKTSQLNALVRENKSILHISKSRLEVYA